MGRSKPTVKSFDIPKRLIVEAWEKVQANGGAPGVDAVSIAEFGSEERNNLYTLWNRMSAGSYLPSPVRAVEIPKDHGAGVRTLGVPTEAALCRLCWNSQWSLLPIRFRDVDPLDRSGQPGRGVPVDVHRYRCPVGRGQRDLTVDARCLAASVALRDPSNARKRVRPAAQHQFLQVADLLEVPFLRRLEDPSPQSPYVILDRTPRNAVPVQVVVLRSVHRHGRNPGLCRSRCRRGA